VPELWSFTITNPDNGGFVLNMVYTDSKGKIQVKTTSLLRGDSSAGTVKNALDYWYWRVYRGHTSVTKTMYDADGQVTTDSGAASQVVYEVEVLKRLAGFSFTTI